MSEVVIKVEHVGKKYRLGAGRGGGEGLRHILQNTLAAPLRALRNRKAAGPEPSSPKSPQEEFWALQDVSFTVRKGEVVGIIGRNGAGKSTLLKLLSRITEPTRGRIEIEGRVASLLEVGTGFHAELTGRENIFLNGTILGMTRAEIKTKFDEIVQFAEVETFLDTPVKHYSSGMYVRLAFSVAAHLEPDVLVVDEVLAVGDAPFQQKCLGKMREVSSREGRTVLFVSHNMAAVLQLTSRCIVLERGRILHQGETEKAVEIYTEASTGGNQVFYDVENVRRQHLGSQTAKIISLRFDRRMALFNFAEDFEFLARVRAQRDVAQFRIGLTLLNSENVPVGSCFSPPRPGLAAGEEIEVKVKLPRLQLAPGHYHCGVTVGKGDHKSVYLDFDLVFDTLHFEVLPEAVGAASAYWHRAWGSLIFSELTISS